MAPAYTYLNLINFQEHISLVFEAKMGMFAGQIATWTTLAHSMCRGKKLTGFNTF